MRVQGYSERGAINALLYELRYRHGGAQLLAQLLSVVSFPLRPPRLHPVRDATILVEQSLSDFGDADAVILLEGDDVWQTVFLEAKVKPAQQAEWRIEDEFARFAHGVSGKGTLHSSNLFTQLYHKMRFAESLRDGSLQATGAVAFPPCSSKERRSIGHNPVVLRATQLVKEHLDYVSYVALLPDTQDNLDAFLKALPDKHIEEMLPSWDLDCVGVLSWESIVTFCTANGLGDTLDVLRYNAEQIYVPAATGRVTVVGNV